MSPRPPINPNNPPPVLSTGELAKLLRRSNSTLWQWAQTPAWAGCLVPHPGKNLLWSTARLRERGFLTEPETGPGSIADHNSKSRERVLFLG